MKFDWISGIKLGIVDQVSDVQKFILCSPYPTTNSKATISTDWTNQIVTAGLCFWRKIWHYIQVTSKFFLGFCQNANFRKNSVNFPISFKPKVAIAKFIGKMQKKSDIKVHIFWEGHKILRNLHLTFSWHYIRQK